MVKKFIGTDADSKETDYLDDYLDDRANDNIELSRGICDDGLDFDVTKPELLVDFEYDIDGPTIQTFELSNEEDESEASCSETGSSCGVGDLYASEGSDAVVAVGLEILDNWGNEDYTCLYRFRVHGDAVIEEADGDNKQ